MWKGRDVRDEDREGKDGNMEGSYNWSLCKGKAVREATVRSQGPKNQGAEEATNQSPFPHPPL